MEASDIILPRLRLDLRLLEAAYDKNANPTWQLYCPVRGQYFRLGLVEFELLSRWHLRNIRLLHKTILRETSLNISLEDIQAFLTFLITHNLTLAESNESIAELCEQGRTIKQEKKNSYLKGYLFLRFTLCHPDRFLTKTLPYIRFVYTETFMLCWLVAVLFGFGLLIANWHAFIYTFVGYLNIKGLFYSTVSIMVSKIIHELGHAYTSKYFGARVSAIGVAFLIMWPVLFTNTTDAWKLTSKKQRLLINAAGMIAELGLATIFLFAWFLLPAGPLQSTCYFIATISWIMTLFINLNPCMRFDGYYLLADYLEISNLQKVSFSLAKWNLKRLFFGLALPKPYAFKKRLHRFLIGYAYATWLYRFFLFLGIALIIYLMMFKTLGIILMLSVIYQMFAKPVITELKEYYKLKPLMTWNKHSIICALTLVGLVLVLFFPWQIREAVPAVYQFGDRYSYHAPKPAQLVKLNTWKNATVKKGQVLLTLESPQLNYDMQQSERDIKRLGLKVEQELKNTKLHFNHQANQQELIKAIQTLRGQQNTKNKMTLTAPFDGRVTYLLNPLHIGQWIEGDKLVIELADTTNTEVVGYISAASRHYLQENKAILFIPDLPSMDSFQAKIISVDKSNLQQIDNHYVLTPFGGDIEANKSLDNYKPVHAVFRLQATPLAKHPFQHDIVGRALIHTKRESIASMLWRNTVSTLIREFKF